MKTTLYLFTLLWFYSFSAQAQWLQQKQGLRYIHAIIPADSNTVWVSHNGLEKPNLVSKTSDGGKTWKLVDTPPRGGFGPYMINTISAINDSTCWFVAHYNRSNLDPNRIFFTNNGGNSWQTMNLPGPGSWDYMHFFTQKEGILIKYYPKLEIYSTHDFGFFFNNRIQNLPDSVVQPGVNPYGNCLEIRGNTIWQLNGGGAYILKSSDRGRNWQVFPTGSSPSTSPVARFAMAFSDTLNGLLYSSEKILKRTNDGGKTWKEVEYSGAAIKPALTALPGTDTYISSSGTGSVFTQDHGLTWKSLNDTITISTLKFSDARNGWAGTAYGEIYKFDSKVLRQNQLSPLPLKIYPNPGTGLFMLEAPEGTAVKISIFNTLGELVREQQLQVTDPQTVIDFRSLTLGLYFFRTETSAGLTTTRIIIQ